MYDKKSCAEIEKHVRSWTQNVLLFMLLKETLDNVHVKCLRSDAFYRKLLEPRVN